MANCGQLADGSSPTLTTANLQNNGNSNFYQIQYDATITSAAAQAAFETLRENCDLDFNWMQQMFNGAASPWSGQMQVNILSGSNPGGGTGACWPDLSGPITLYPGVPANNSTATVDPWFLRYLIVSEVVEMLMASTGSDWYGGNWSSGGDEGSAGEGLSRFFGAQLLIQKHGASSGEPGYAVSNQWMNSPRNDFVNNVSPTDNSIDPVIGCATVFVYYLFTQLACPIPVMTANGAQELSGVYANITGDNADPFPFFLNLINIGYPGTATITGPNPDNPWPIALVSFVGVKSTFGADEARDIIDSQGGLVSGAFTLWIQGLSQASFSSLNIEVSAFTGVFANLPGVKIQPNPLGAQFESGVSQYAPQRIQIPFDIVLTAPFLNQFPSSGVTPFALSVSLTSGSNTVTASQASTQIELVAGADPYFSNINSSDSNYPYLSQDLRVFMVTPGLIASPIPGVSALTDSVSGAYTYIQNVLNHFNDPMVGFTNPNGPDPFTTVLPSQGDADQADSSVYPWTVDFATFKVLNNYSFAIARVRLRGSSGVPGEATNVRVFFRMWASQSNDTDYDPTTTYAFAPDSVNEPGSPNVGAGNTTFPFFATNNFASQTDYGSGGINNKTLAIPNNQDTLWAYYGCFLNLYDPNNQFNNQQIQTYLPGTHHCLVAQIAYDDAPIPTGVSPLSWDQLAQRNLQFTSSDNPGPAATHRIPQTFDCRPSRGYAALSGLDTVFPDELMINWGQVPSGSIASLYWPQVLASDVVKLAQQFYGASPLSAVDAHTIKIPITGGLSYVPIPTGSGQNFAGLFTVDLPSSVRSGESYDITVMRIGTRSLAPPPPPPPTPPIQTRSAAAKSGGDAKRTHATQSAPVSQPLVETTTTVEGQIPKSIRWRYVIGTFQVHIPVTTAANILPSEETTLAIMKWRLQQMSPTNRWYPVLIRYIGYLSGRVDGLGGNAAAIPASLSYVPSALQTGCEGQEFTGKVGEVIFDCHGDFDGFVLDDCCETHVFRSRTSRIGELALKACREELKVTVIADRRNGRIMRISVRR
ncbi:MAG: hypothetical protein WCC04_20755 [Terriglobales bacterium]